MDSENSKKSDLNRLLLSLTEKIDSRRKDKKIALSNLVFAMHGKIQESFIRTINLKFRLQHGMKNLNYLTDHILYHIFNIILNIY